MMSSDKHLGSEITYGDERERAVLTTAGTVGMLCGFYFCILTGLVFALFGHLLVPFVLVLLAAVPAIIFVSYAEKRGVDAFDILARSTKSTSATSNMATLSILLLLSASMIYTTATGAGLLEFDVSDTWAERFTSMGNGVGIGAAVGAIGGYLLAAGVVRRRRKKQQEEAAQPDED